RLPVGPADDSFLRLPQPVAGIEEQIDVTPVSTRELVQGPRGDRRLASLRNRVGRPAVARVLQLTRKSLPLGDERIGLDAVEVIERFVQRHPGEATARWRTIPAVEQTKFLLDESQLPRHWYNVAADMPNAARPVLHPGTGEPVGPDDLAPLFPME